MSDSQPIIVHLDADTSALDKRLAGLSGQLEDLVRLLRERTAPDFYTPEQAARVLQVNRTTIYELIQQGKLPAFSVGRHYRVSRAALLETAATARFPRPQQPQG